MPVSTLTGHTDAVEHAIDTGDSLPIRCAPRRMSPQKIKQEEASVEEMLTGGQIEPSDSPWSALGGVGNEKGRWDSVLCGLPPVEFGDGQRCLALTSH